MEKRTIEENDYGKHGPNETMKMENNGPKKTMTMENTSERIE